MLRTNDNAQTSCDKQEVMMMMVVVVVVVMVMMMIRYPEPSDT